MRWHCGTAAEVTKGIHTQLHFNSTLPRLACLYIYFFINGRYPQQPGIAGDDDSTRGLDESYMANFVDSLKRAHAHGVYVIPTLNSIPLIDYQAMLTHGGWYTVPGILNRKPLFIGEYSFFVNRQIKYETADDAKALVAFRDATYVLGVRGWALWTFDTEHEALEFIVHANDGDYEIAEALAHYHGPEIGQCEPIANPGFEARGLDPSGEPVDC